jgi:hypothetical protein
MKRIQIVILVALAVIALTIYATLGVLLVA